MIETMLTIARKDKDEDTPALLQEALPARAIAAVKSDGEIVVAK